MEWNGEARWPHDLGRAVQFLSADTVICRELCSAEDGNRIGFGQAVNARKRGEGACL